MLLFSLNLDNMNVGSEAQGKIAQINRLRLPCDSLSYCIT